MDIRFSDGTILSIPPGIVRSVSGYLDDTGFSRESGGILLGMRDEAKPSFVLVSTTFPGMLDRRRPFHFVRSKVAANRAIRRAWSQSGGKVNYIGEWHTHNEPAPTPSSTDGKLVRAVIRDGSCPFDRVFMLIIGNDGEAFLNMASTEAGGSLEMGVTIPWQT